MAGGGFLWQRDFCLLYCKAAVLLETAGQQRDPYREGRNHENNLDSIRVQEELLETVKVLQDAELEELLNGGCIWLLWML